jgi:Holliday junction resolvase
MASTPEALVKRKVVAVLKAHDAYYFYPVMGGYGRSGIPDIICCVNGYFLAIECKAGRGKTTALQELELEKIATAGGQTLVINETNLDKVAEVLLCLQNKPNT